MKVVQLPLSQISCDPLAQPRVQLDQGVIGDYVEAMREGASFPPVIVFRDGDNHHLADGWHRLKAAHRAGRTADRRGEIHLLDQGIKVRGAEEAPAKVVDRGSQPKG